MSKDTSTKSGFFKNSKALWAPIALAAVTIAATAITATFAPTAAFVVLVIGAIVTVVVSLLYGAL